MSLKRRRLAVGLIMVFAFAAWAAITIVPTSLAEAVIGGRNKQFNFVARLYYPDGGLCSGVLIHPQIVLTAKHCTRNGGNSSDPTQVGFGASGATNLSPVTRVDYYGTDRDLAVLLIPRISGVGVPTRTNYDLGALPPSAGQPPVLAPHIPSVGTLCVFFGFGQDHVGQQRAADVRITEIIGSEIWTSPADNPTKSGQTGPGDSGGPLFCQGGEVVGVVKSGFSSAGSTASAFTIIDWDWLNSWINTLLWINFPDPRTGYNHPVNWAIPASAPAFFHKIAGALSGRGTDCTADFDSVAASTQCDVFNITAATAQPIQITLYMPRSVTSTGLPNQGQVFLNTITVVHSRSPAGVAYQMGYGFHRFFASIGVGETLTIRLGSDAPSYVSYFLVVETGSMRGIYPMMMR